MPEPRISILMLSYNRPQLIGRAIASASRQTLEDWELIIVQDGFNPQTAELLKDWLAREPRIRFFQRGTVGSIAEASNFGLEKARGEYIAILDDDDYWCHPDKLARQAEFLDTHPDYVGCGGGYIGVDQEERERGRFLKPERDETIRATALLANPIANSTSMFRRVVNGKPVLYDTSMRGYADWDFWLTMATCGKLYNFPEYLAYYALWEGSGSFQASKRNGEAAIRIVRKHRRHYRGFWFALSLMYLHYWYTCLPPSVRRMSYVSLSAFKKALVSSRKGGAGASACPRPGEAEPPAPR
jgi:glycosyltransferase involved in cell wall biosynthesis